MSSSLISPKYQIVIPKEIRRNLGLKPGQRMQMTAAGDHIELRPVLSPDQLIGYLKSDQPLVFEREADREL